MEVSLTTKNIPEQANIPDKPQTLNSDDKSYTYTYILTTLKQREKINLEKHKPKLEKIIKEFFGSNLVSVTIHKDRYTLKLKNEFDIGAKRKLGRLISENSGLKQYVNTVIYNGNKDTSGQLFRLKKHNDDKSL